MVSFHQTKLNLHVIHGFLGQPTDFDFVECENVTVIKHSIWDNMKDTCDFSSWSQNFIQKIEPGFNLLMGYSLGGRLSLHLLEMFPSYWKGAIFISTHPGIDCEKEKKDRYINDKKWADIWLKEDWTHALNQWNAQKVFKTTSKEQKKYEKTFNREWLAKALVNFSLSRQKNFKFFLESINIPLLWLVGQNDEKFVSLSEHLLFRNQHSSKIVVKDAGHRIHLDQQSLFTKILKNFIQEIEYVSHT
ncbi:2-succinyl-6-hydroxy-2, 4-cyclohexadiene-1-carboxylate synthase [Candidatus Rubidus massiliensis]|nr:MAG: hypothetical protein BGO10_06080 [Chlamydia sp. 32-24]CDZ81738.1 2-succinyl-6-hydroxy-2, 4-cyclohexadiene-1-carboxylate synthase [Candidatus Rubidus massiliensis]